jgi:hypothetical protein
MVFVHLHYESGYYVILPSRMVGIFVEFEGGIMFMNGIKVL